MLRKNPAFIAIIRHFPVDVFNENFEHVGKTHALFALRLFAHNSQRVRAGVTRHTLIFKWLKSVIVLESRPNLPHPTHSLE